MSKLIKLVISIFIGADIFVVAYLALSQLRHLMFGTGDIPGGGSALDMALFLLPLFIGYVCGDRLYYFLTYSERRAAKLKATQTLNQAKLETSVKAATSNEAKSSDAIWQDSGWDDSQLETDPSVETAHTASAQTRPNLTK